MDINPIGSLEVTEQDILDYVDADPDSELACLCDTLGAKGVLDLVSIYGGGIVYVPNLKTIQISKRNRLITKDFQEGMSITQLARRYRITTRSIHTIVYGK